jgi:hypothetical protein
MMATHEIESTVDDALYGTEGYPVALTEAQYDELEQAIGIVQALWYLEEAYDNVLQNGVEMELDVARLVANQRSNITSFPEEADIELRLLNRRLTNFLAGARSFVDSVQSAFSRAPTPISSRRSEFTDLLAKQFDAEFSYRFMEGLRNHTQHQSSAISQSLIMGRTWHSRSDSMRVISVVPQIDRDDLIENGKIRANTRDEIAEECDEMIDLMPHLSAYVRCFGKVVLETRDMFSVDLQGAVNSHNALLQKHLDGEWNAAWVRPRSDQNRAKLLYTSTHDLRRLQRIRLRNVARDPE